MYCVEELTRPKLRDAIYKRLVVLPGVETTLCNCSRSHQWVVVVVAWLNQESYQASPNKIKMGTFRNLYSSKVPLFSYLYSNFILLLSDQQGPISPPVWDSRPGLSLSLKPRLDFKSTKCKEIFLAY